VFTSICLGNPRIQPSNFIEEDVVSKEASDFLFLGCIKYIQEVKTGPFYEHSNQLWNISGLPGWNKVNQGLIKMYKGEVLAKFPVIQHVLFGSLISLKPFDKSKLTLRMQGRHVIPNVSLSVLRPPSPVI